MQNLGEVKLLLHPLLEQLLNHLRQPRPHILDAFQTLAPHLSVDQSHVLLQVLDRPRRLAARPDALTWGTIQLQPVAPIRALDGIYLDALGACVYGKLLGNQCYEVGSYDVG